MRTTTGKAVHTRMRESLETFVETADALSRRLIELESEADPLVGGLGIDAREVDELTHLRSLMAITSAYAGDIAARLDYEVF